MELITRINSITDAVYFDDEMTIDVYNEYTEDEYEEIEITEVVYVNDIRYIVNDRINREYGFEVFASRYHFLCGQKECLHLMKSDADNHYFYTIEMYKI